MGTLSGARRGQVKSTAKNAVDLLTPSSHQRGLNPEHLACKHQH